MIQTDVKIALVFVFKNRVCSENSGSDLVAGGVLFSISSDFLTLKEKFQMPYWALATHYIYTSLIWAEKIRIVSIGIFLTH